MNKLNYSKICGNCGKVGHKYKHCNYPIMSYGIICINYCNNINKLLKNKNKNNNENKLDIKYLMMKRRHTIGFSDFVRGKYSLLNSKNIQYLKKLIDIMTISEKELITKLTFEELWKELWVLEITIKNRMKEYNKSETLFNKLTNGFTYKGIKLNLQQLVNESTTNWIETEWGFPKGRRNFNENNITCARREFTEETGIQNGDYELIELDPISETLIGTNYNRYKFIYYIAQTNKIELTLSKNNVHQLTEVGGLKWMTFEEASSAIRFYNQDKIKMLNKLNYTLNFIVNNIT